MSRSWVKRGRPCAARAWAPTSRYRTPWRFNAPRNSCHSGRSSTVQTPGGATDRLDRRDAFLDRGAQPVADIVRDRTFERGLDGEAPGHRGDLTRRGAVAATAARQVARARRAP